jgi:hypothetical protein
MPANITHYITAILSEKYVCSLICTTYLCGDAIKRDNTFLRIGKSRPDVVTFDETLCSMMIYFGDKDWCFSALCFVLPAQKVIAKCLTYTDLAVAVCSVSVSVFKGAVYFSLLIVALSLFSFFGLLGTMPIDVLLNHTVNNVFSRFLFTEQQARKIIVRHRWQ